MSWLCGGCWLGSMVAFYMILNPLEYHKPRSRITELQRRILFVCPCDNLSFPQELLFFFKVLPLRLLYLKSVMVFPLLPKLVFNLLEGRDSAFIFF